MTKLKIAAIFQNKLQKLIWGQYCLNSEYQLCSFSNSGDKDICKLEKKILHTDGEQRTENGEQRTQKPITEASPFAVLMEHGIE